MPFNWTTQSGYLTSGMLNKQFQKAAMPLMKFRQFVSMKQAFGKNKGQTVNWLKVGNLAANGRKLAETSTIPESSQSLTWGTATLDEYGISVPFTFKLEALSEFDIKQIVRDGLLDDAAKVIDGSVERAFDETPLRWVGTSTTAGSLTTNGTATSTNSSVLNLYHLLEMKDYLKARNVPGYGSLEGDYVFIGSSTCMKNLFDDLKSYNSYVETGYKKLLNGEVGRFAGVRFVEDNFACNYVYDSTAGSSTAISWTNSKSKPGYMFGSPTVMEVVAVPEEIRVKEPSDYGRSKGIAWYGIFGWEIMWDDASNARIIKWDSAA